MNREGINEPEATNPSINETKVSPHLLIIKQK